MRLMILGRVVDLSKLCVDNNDNFIAISSSTLTPYFVELDPKGRFFPFDYAQGENDRSERRCSPLFRMIESNNPGLVQEMGELGHPAKKLSRAL